MTLSHSQIMRGFISILQEDESDIDFNLIKECQEVKRNFQVNLENFQKMILPSNVIEPLSNEKKIEIINGFENIKLDLQKILYLMEKISAYQIPLIDPFNLFDHERMGPFIEMFNSIDDDFFDDRVKTIIRLRNRIYFGESVLRYLVRIRWSFVDHVENYIKTRKLLRNTYEVLTTKYPNDSFQWKDNAKGHKDPVRGFIWKKINDKGKESEMDVNAVSLPKLQKK